MSPPGHSNLVSLVAHNFTKLALLKAYLRIQRFEVLYFNILICIFETYPVLVLQRMMEVGEYLDMIPLKLVIFPESRHCESPILLENP